MDDLFILIKEDFVFDSRILEQLQGIITTGGHFRLFCKPKSKNPQSSGSQSSESFNTSVGLPLSDIPISPNDSSLIFERFWGTQDNQLFELRTNRILNTNNSPLDLALGIPEDYQFLHLYLKKKSERKKNKKKPLKVPVDEKDSSNLDPALEPGVFTRVKTALKVLRKALKKQYENQTPTTLALTLSLFAFLLWVFIFIENPEKQGFDES